MIRPQLVAQELEQIQTISNLTGVFESIASLQIAKIKHQVLASKGFFDDLWRLYVQLRVEDQGEFGSAQKITEKRELFVAVTGEGGFSGDIDQKLIDWMLSKYSAGTTDIIVIGHHGAIQLAQRGVTIKQYFKLPSKDQDVVVGPMLDIIERYPKTTAYYQTYVSLSIQDVKSISLQAAVKNLSDQVTSDDDTISTRNYTFEPSAEEVIGHLESSMLGIALSQVILESKLAQYASRFKAMTAAHDRSRETRTELTLAYNRARRSLADERIKETINSMRQLRVR